MNALKRRHAVLPSLANSGCRGVLHSVRMSGIRVTGTTRTAPVDCAVAAQVAQTLASAPAPSVAPAAGADRMTVTLLRAAGTVDLGEAQGGDPLSTTARTLLDDVQLPPDQRTVCR